MALADFLKALASVEDEIVHGVVGAFMTADAVAHQAFGKSPIYFDAARVQRLAATMLTYFGGDPLGRPAIEPQPERPRQGQQGGGDGNISEGAGTGIAAGGAGAGAGGGPAPATAQTFEEGIRETAGRVVQEVRAGGMAALDLGEEGLHAIEEALGRTAEPERPPPARIAGS